MLNYRYCTVPYSYVLLVLVYGLLFLVLVLVLVLAKVQILVLVLGLYSKKNRMRETAGGRDEPAMSRCLLTVLCGTL